MPNGRMGRSSSTMLSATRGHNLSNVMARPIPSYGFHAADCPAIAGSNIVRGRGDGRSPHLRISKRTVAQRGHKMHRRSAVQKPGTSSLARLACF